ncbi:hypothetical protein COMNV_00708 [Commensalibacter sp. Nvir]|nr:hypothetical protein COMNV_00708 [Commensalibacter sp. Nvir]
MIDKASGNVFPLKISYEEPRALHDYEKAE